MRAAWISLVVLVAWGVVAASHRPEADLAMALQAPGARHLWGADALGRDMLQRVGAGLGLSLWVGLWASVVAVGVGTLYGATAALLGGRADRLLMRGAEVMNALPLILIVVLVSLYAGRSIWALLVAVGAVEWSTLARVVRARLLRVREKDFVKASRIMGGGGGRVLLAHLLPHTAGVVLVYALLNLPAILILEATLSYLGLGVQPPQASLGVLLSEGAQAMTTHPWLLWGPSGAFVWMLATIYALGEGLKRKMEG